jgi:membrane fusion protein (multidrug efflux system)
MLYLTFNFHFTSWINTRVHLAWDSNVVHKKKKKKKKKKRQIYCYQSYKIDTSFTKQYVSQIRSVWNIEIRVQKGCYKHLRDEGQYEIGQLLFRIMLECIRQLLKAQSRSQRRWDWITKYQTLARKKYSFQKRTVFGSSQLSR